MLNSPTAALGNEGSLTCPIGRMLPIGSVQHRGIVQLMLVGLYRRLFSLICRDSQIYIVKQLLIDISSYTYLPLSIKYLEPSSRGHGLNKFASCDINQEASHLRVSFEKENRLDLGSNSLRDDYPEPYSGNLPRSIGGPPAQRLQQVSRKINSSPSYILNNNRDL